MKKKNSDKYVVRDIFLDEFSFLIEQYDFSLIKKEVDSWFTKVKYANKCCVITLFYEVKDFVFNVIISQLVDGKEVLHPGSFFIHEDDAFYEHSLHDVVDLLSPEDRACYDEKKGLRNYIAKLASNLKKFGPPFFSGDFSLFPSLDKIVIARVMEWNKEWGYTSENIPQGLIKDDE